MTAHAKLHKPLDAADLGRRRKAYDDYLALCHFEGIEFTNEMKDDAERLLNGEMTPEKYTAFVTAKYRARAAAEQ